MRLMTFIKASVLVPVLCLAALPVLAQQDSSQQATGDPVADAARKARAQKKDEPKPKKVFTEDDIRKTPAPSTAAATTTPAGDAAAAPADSNSSSSSDKNEEVAWRKKFADQHARIAAAEKELDVLQRESEKAQLQYYPDPQKALTQQNTRKDINDTNAKIDAKKREIAQLKQGLDDLEDALRKAGGDSGWAR